MFFKGLQLIAQFSFQRATGGFTRKIIPATGDKKPECRFSFFGRSDFQNRYALKIDIPTRTVNTFFNSSCPLSMSVVKVAASGTGARIFNLSSSLPVHVQNLYVTG